MPIDVDDARARSAAGQCEPQEQLAAIAFRFGDNMNSRLAGRIHGPIQVCPVACDLDVGFVYAPGSIRAADLTANPLISSRSRYVSECRRYQRTPRSGSRGVERSLSQNLILTSVVLGNSI